MQRLTSWTFPALLALALIACVPVGAAPAPAPTASPLNATPAPATDTPRTITVVGAGTVSLVPDVAQIHVGVDVRADTVLEAKSAVDEQIAAIHAALIKMGVEAQDIQTNHYTIHYEREPTPMVVASAPTAPAPDGYRVSNMLQVTVRDVERAGAMLDAVVEAGANQVYGVNFTVSDEDKWQSQARERAVADAYARADELAGLANAERGEVLAVSEVIGGIYTQQMPRAVLSGIGGGGGGFAPGELEMGTQVQVTFALQ